MKHMRHIRSQSGRIMKPPMNDLPLLLSETTHMLYADVDEWSLDVYCPRPGAASGRPARMLRLSGTTASLFADAEKPLSLELGLILGELPADIAVQPWQLALIDELEEYGIPTLLDGLLTLHEQIWSGVKESLYLAASKPGFTVRVRLETRELLEKPSELDPERNFAVIGFESALHHTKDCR